MSSDYHTQAIRELVGCLRLAETLALDVLAGINDDKHRCEACGLDRYESFAEHKLAEETKTTIERMRKTRDALIVRLNAAAQEGKIP